jgi:hypothetical protein
MNHKIQKYNNGLLGNLLIIDDNKNSSSHIVFYNYNLQNYYIYVKSNKPEIIKYLETNNVGTISSSNAMTGGWKIITLNKHILLELI